jgi:hypothetical protein
MSRSSSDVNASRWSLIGRRDVSAVCRDCGPTALAVLVLIDTFADRDGRGAWPRQQVIADELGVSRRSVSRAVAALKRAGHLSMNRRLTPYGLVNEYEVHHLTSIERR